jgi:hypothetical protein
MKAIWKLKPTKVVFEKEMMPLFRQKMRTLI